jgi:hypothetical protein
MPLDFDDIVKVVVSFAPQPIRKVNIGGTVFTGGPEINIGASARLVSLEPDAHGFKIEVKNSSDVWVEQLRYTEA